MSLDFLKSPVFMRVCAGCANGNEATAYIDPENEALVQKAISALTVGKTLIVIAHRLSTIVGADNIVVVKDGTVHAQGTHEKLLETCPLYRDMWQAHIGAKDQM